MNSNIKQLADEAHQIIVNARHAMMDEEISQDEYWRIIKNLFEDVGYQTEILSQPR